ncbi:hypothetical protein V0288_03640 [Pannus brasiliensis CCIBt3594]|uniref:Ribbon-helix-helix protein CopG domain-containing protein n=1 Tax=Pannus brasiliensis CCIBt3594 TaxID=1427578 RepID=A0AAW9QRG9_9CHRO
MSRILTLQVSDRVYRALQQKAETTGISIVELAVNFLEERADNGSDRDNRSETEKEAARKRFRSHIGAIKGYPPGSDNESIDAGLAREYANDHEEIENP